MHHIQKLQFVRVVEVRRTQPEGKQGIAQRNFQSSNHNVITDHEICDQTHTNPFQLILRIPPRFGNMDLTGVLQSHKPKINCVNPRRM
jgi:hypothetical protein